MNLLFFGSDFNVGLTTALTEQILEIQKRKDVINLTAISSDCEMEEGLFNKLKQANVNLNVINDLDIHRNFKTLSRKVENIIKTNNITHINVHNNWQLALVSYIKYKRFIPKKFKIIYTIHGYRNNHFIKSILAICIIGLALLLFADRVICMSSFVRKRFWLVRYKTNLVFYMMSQDEFNKKVNTIETHPLRLIFPARFQYGKNQIDILKALKGYIEESNDQSIHLFLPGEGPLKKECEDFTKDNHLEENVTFPGKISFDKVIDLQNSCNVSIISSTAETYGRCISEPFCLGRCVITRRVGIAEDIIRNNENGFFFNTTSQLKRLLLYLHNNPDRIEKIANQAFKDKEIFSSNNVFEKYYNALLKA